MLWSKVVVNTHGNLYEACGRNLIYFRGLQFFFSTLPGLNDYRYVVTFTRKARGINRPFNLSKSEERVSSSDRIGSDRASSSAADGCTGKYVCAGTSLFASGFASSSTRHSWF
jgi:hypothetical protein